MIYKSQSSRKKLTYTNNNNKHKDIFSSSKNMKNTTKNLQSIIHIIHNHILRPTRFFREFVLISSACRAHHVWRKKTSSFDPFPASGCVASSVPAPVPRVSFLKRDLSVPETFILILICSTWECMKSSNASRLPYVPSIRYTFKIKHPFQIL